MSFSSRISLAVILVLAVALPAVGQITSSIHGVIRDANGAVVPGATVTFESPALRRSNVAVVSDEEGRFRMAGLQPGTYTVKVELQGFADAVLTGVELALNTDVPLNVVLQVKAFEEAVTVRGEAPAVRTEESGLGVQIDNRTIDGIPLNGRQFLDLTVLVPGVSTRPSSSDQGSNLTVFGERSITNSFLVDGMDNNDLVSRDFAEFFIQDAIQEFKVMIAGFPAEFGKASGAVANVITRSGTNRFSGRGFLFLRNDALDSSNIEGQEPQELNRVETGGTFGGPIVRNRTYFFEALQFLREERGLNFDQSRLPPIVQAGYFSPAVGGVEPFDAAPLAKNWTNFVKIDHQFNSENLLFVTMNLNRGTNDGFVPPPEQAFSSPPPGSIALPSTASDVKRQTSSLNGRYTFFLNQSAFLESSVRWSRADYEENTEKPQGAEQIFPLTFIPAFQIWQSNSSAIGSVDRQQDRLQWTESLSYYKSTGRGSHNLKFGSDFDRAELDQLFLPPTGIILGNSALDTRFTELRYNISMQRFIAPILSANQSAHASTNNIGLFAQDRWELLPGLSLNLGIRYDYASLFSDDTNNIAPRVGFAWDVGSEGKTVFRGGYGRFYDQSILETVLLTPDLGGVQLGTLDLQVIPRGGSFYNNPSLGAYGPLQDSGTRWLANPKFYSYMIPAGDIRTSGSTTITGLGQPYIIYDLLGIAVPNRASPPVLTATTIPQLTGGRLTAQAALNIINAFFPVPQGPQFAFLEETGPNSLVTGQPFIFKFRQLQAEVASVQTIEHPTKTPYTDSFNLGIERAVARDFSIDAEVFIRRSRDLLVRRAVGLLDVPVAANCAGNTVGGGPCNRQLQYIGFLDTNALTLSLNKRFSHRYSFLASYTFTDATDNFSTLRVPPRGGETSFLFNNHPELDEGQSLNTPEHVFVFSGQYQMPGGFNLSGVVRSTSGRPFNAAGMPLDSDGDDIFDNRLIGTEKGEFLTDEFFQIDLRAAYEFRLGGTKRATALIELFNLTNRANPFVVNRTFGPNLGDNIQPLPGREVQIGFRFDF